MAPLNEKTLIIPTPLGEELTPGEMELRRSGGVYNDDEIRQGLKEGWIVIDPFDQRRIQNSSVDVTLGKNFYGTDKEDGRRILNMFDPESGRRYFKFFQAKPHGEMLEILNQRHPFVGIPLDARIVVLEPGERVLGHTQQAIGIKRGGTTQMQAKSTTGRWGTGVCLDAGWGDEGFVAQWTMEIVNVNLHHALVLVVGMPIAQIVFYKMNPSSSPYDKTGHYLPGAGKNAGRAKAWTPDMMLPRVLTAADL